MTSLSLLAGTTVKLLYIGCFFQIVARGMVDRGNGGSIVMISSIAGMKALEKRTVYCSSKGALDQLTRCLALELGPHKVMKNENLKRISKESNRKSMYIQNHHSWKCISSSQGDYLNIVYSVRDSVVFQEFK